MTNEIIQKMAEAIATMSMKADGNAKLWESEAQAAYAVVEPMLKELVKELSAIGHQTTITTGHYNRLQMLLDKLPAELRGV